jgi:hypothetical protein
LWLPGEALQKIINRSGFQINAKKNAPDVPSLAPEGYWPRRQQED